MNELTNQLTSERVVLAVNKSAEERQNLNQQFTKTKS